MSAAFTNSEYGKPPSEMEERFWSYVQKTASCWWWIGPRLNTGYGQMHYGGKTLLAHRVSWKLAGKTLVKGLTLDHLCRNRACVNPDHLEQVTHKQNILRGIGCTARNAKKMHCPKGHPYDEKNTLRYWKGRMCRTCARAANRAWRARAKCQTTR